MLYSFSFPLCLLLYSFSILLYLLLYSFSFLLHILLYSFSFPLCLLLYSFSFLLHLSVVFFLFSSLSSIVFFLFSSPSSGFYCILSFSILVFSLSFYVCLHHAGVLQSDALPLLKNIVYLKPYLAQLVFELLMQFEISKSSHKKFSEQNHVTNIFHRQMQREMETGD